MNKVDLARLVRDHWDLVLIEERLGRAQEWVSLVLPGVDDGEDDKRTAGAAAVAALVERSIPQMLERLRYLEQLVVELATTAQVSEEGS